MASSFPFVDPFLRVENALWGVFHCQKTGALAGALASVWDIWSLHPVVFRRTLATHTRLLKVAVFRIFQTAKLHKNVPLDQLYTLLSLLHSLISGSIHLRQYANQLNADQEIIRIQGRFSEFTSGWRLCNELRETLSWSYTFAQEFIDLGYSNIQDDKFSSFFKLSPSTARSVASTEFKRENHRSPVVSEQIGGNNPQFKLKTLEEHQVATRFQQKRVTTKTWRSALKEAHELVRSGDRVKMAEALYLLLEVLWLDPQGCNRATLYLDSGSIYLEFDHLEEAAKAYHNSLRLDPSNWKARYNLGVTAARLQDFVLATRQLNLALKSCPTGITDEIQTILLEIERIQCARNARAFRETSKDRAFTAQYLESVQQVSPTKGKNRILDSSVLPDDHTLSYRNGLALVSANPQVLDASCEWLGELASLLHRIYTRACCRRLLVQDEIGRIESTRSGRISTQTFNEVVTRITGSPLRTSERCELTQVFGDDGTMLFPFLVPNCETKTALDEIQRLGASHAMLDWRLFRKRSKRSINSRSGGFWYWLDISMAKWIEHVLQGSSLPHLSEETITSIVESLKGLGYLTPMDFAQKERGLPEPDDLPILKLADRGILIYECHRASSCIQDEASRTLQMFGRRNRIHAKRGNKSLNARHEQRLSELRPVDNAHIRLAKDTLSGHQVMRVVLESIEDIIDNLIATVRQEYRDYEVTAHWQEVPVRTEQRQEYCMRREKRNIMAL